MMNTAMQHSMPAFGSNAHHLKKAQKGYVTDNLIINNANGEPLLPSPHLPDDLNPETKKENKASDKSLLMMIGVPLGILGAGAAVTKVLTGVFRKKLPTGDRPPNIGKNINLLTEEMLSTYKAIRDPNTKNILGAMAVFTFSMGALVLKNTVDGIKEIWVNQKTADIQRDYKEKMIDIENRSFAGKKQIVRYMLDQEERKLTKFNKAHNISFTSNKEQTEDTNGLKPAHVIIGVAAAAAATALMTYSIKNIRKMGRDIKDSVNNIRTEFAGSLNKVDENEIDADSLSQKFVSMDFKPDEIKTMLSKSKLSEETKSKVVEKTNGTYTQTHPSLGIDGKTTIFSIINDVSGLFYNFVMEPSKYTAALFGGLAGVAGLSYTGTRFVEANKEVQVERAKANIEVDKNDKLVRVDLKNFMKKKQSAVDPLINDYKSYAQCAETPKEVLKSTYDGIFNEIKNGPPFIYD